MPVNRRHSGAATVSVKDTVYTRLATCAIAMFAVVFSSVVVRLTRRDASTDRKISLNVAHRTAQSPLNGRNAIQ